MASPLALQARIAELEAAQAQTETLMAISHTLQQAANPLALLRACVPPALADGAIAASLWRVEDDTANATKPQTACVAMLSYQANGQRETQWAEETTAALRLSAWLETTSQPLAEAYILSPLPAEQYGGEAGAWLERHSQSMLLLPLTWAGRCLGLLCLYWPQPIAPTQSSYSFYRRLLPMLAAAWAALRPQKPVHVLEHSPAPHAQAISQAELLRFYEASLDIMCVVDAKGLLHSVNPAWQALLAYSYQHLQNKPLISMVHPDDQARTRALWRALLQADAKNTITIENRYRCAAGEYIWLLWNFRYYPQEGRVYGVAKDISVRKQAEVALAHERNMLQTVLDALPAEIYLKDSQGRFMLNNLRSRQALSAPDQPSLLAKDERDFLPAHDAQAILAQDEAVLQTMEPLLDHEWYMEAQQAWLSSSKIPLRDAQGHAHLLSIAYDISDRKQSEAASRSFTMLVEAAADGIVLSSPRGKILYANPAYIAMLGYGEQTIGMDISELIAERDLVLLSQVGQRLEHGKTWQGTLHYKHREGHIIPMLATLFVIRDSEGNIIREAAILRDITPLKRSEEALRRSEARSRALLEAIPDIIFVFDAQGYYLEVSGNTDDLLLPPQELLGKCFLDLLPPEQADPLFERIHRVLRSGHTERYDYDLQIPNGLASFEAHFVKLADDQVLMTTRNITARRQNELALQRRDAILATIATISDTLLASRSWRERIDEVLGYLGEVLMVSRCYIFEMRNTDDYAENPKAVTPVFSQRYEWVAPDISAQMDNPELQHHVMADAGLEHWQKRLEARQVVTVRDDGDLSAAEEALFRGQDIRALALVPIFVGGQWWGFIGIDDCRQAREWTAQELEMFRSVADSLSAAIARERSQQALLESNAHLATLNDVSRGLNSATSAEELLSVLVYAASVSSRSQGLSANLQYIQLDDAGQPLWAEKVALRSDDQGAIGSPLGSRFYMRDYPFTQVYLSHPDSAQCISNIYQDARLDAQSRHKLQEVGIGAIVFIPLNQGGRWVGLVQFHWREPHRFNEREMSLYNALPALVSPVVENRRLLDNLEQEVQERSSQLSRAQAELNIARRIQKLLLPNDDELESIADLDIAGFMEPAAEIGGDYYDVLPYDQGVKIGMGDVTGHGLESGLLMLMAQTAVRTLLTSGQDNSVDFLNILNHTLYDNLQRMRADRSMTLLLLDYQAGHVRISGQHEYVLVVRANGEVECINTMDLGFPIGLEADIAAFVQEIHLDLAAGDGLVLYTDGITEAENSRAQQYGLERLCEQLRRHWPAPAAVVRQRLIDDVYAHIAGHKVYDDITLLVVKRH